MGTFRICFVVTLLAVILADDYYDLLGISKDADNRDIRRAFKKLALTMHPDKNPNDKNAHDEFIKINRAYEVLKDEDMRKKYDLHGEEGLKDDFGASWKGNYQSWTYYYESFGIYDDDPEIITLSRSDFEQSVLGSPDVWFINFYSPQCSHCHLLAPAWRSMARELEGVIRIGAVNCEEDWMLCRQQSINSYPSLILYPEKEKYRGTRETEDMINYILKKLPNSVVSIKAEKFRDVLMNEEYKNRPWLIMTCKEDDECLFNEELKKLSIILNGLVNIGKANPRKDKKICQQLDCTNLLTFHQNLTESNAMEGSHIIKETETKSILNAVLKLLPGPQELDGETFEKIRTELQSTNVDPWLIQFTKDFDVSDTGRDTELKRLRALLPSVQLGYVDCQSYNSICSSFSLRKFPTFIVFKPGGTHEFNHGRFTAHDIATFVRESLTSQVKTLSPEDFPTVTNSADPWFIDFYAPWCPPCMQLLPEWRKVSRAVGHLVKFGTVDCTIHSSLCSKYNIRSYPTTILYNQSIPHQFHGMHSRYELEEFVKDTLNPPVILLSDDNFKKLLGSKTANEMWLVDFFAPWCGPCQQLSPEWRKLAKMLKHDSSIHVGQVDCTAQSNLCSSNDIQSYPTIRLYPKGFEGTSKFHLYNGWHRDASTLQSWVYNFLPSKVKALDDGTFHDVRKDSSPWLVDFYAPWCGHCQVFAPEFEKIAQAFDGKVNTGKVNCDILPQVCKQASVRAYPTVMFYRGVKDNTIQNPIGEELEAMTYDSIVKFLEVRLNIKLTKIPKRDEL